MLCVSAILPTEVTSAENQIQLNSDTLIEGRHACPGQNVTFTCVVTNGTLVLVWKSDHYQYIDTNHALQFSASEHKVNDTMKQGTTVATLTKVGNEGHICESQLELIASPDIPTVSIICSDQSNPSNQATINFTLLGEYLEIVTSYWASS